MTKRKQKSALPLIGVPTTPSATHAFFAAEDQDPVAVAQSAQNRRRIAAFFTERAKRLHTTAEEARKMPLSVSEQLNLSDALQRIGPRAGNRGYGSYPQEPIGFRDVGEHLVRRAREDESIAAGVSRPRA
jgi:hypothetical protein